MEELTDLEVENGTLQLEYDALSLEHREYFTCTLNHNFDLEEELETEYVEKANILSQKQGDLSSLIKEHALLEIDHKMELEKVKQLQEKNDNLTEEIIALKMKLEANKTQNADIILQKWKIDYEQEKVEHLLKRKENIKKCIAKINDKFFDIEKQKEELKEQYEQQEIKRKMSQKDGELIIIQNERLKVKLESLSHVRIQTEKTEGSTANEAEEHSEEENVLVNFVRFI
eukprot:TRINITY_DN9395_c0_g2_i2.p2 TRINITY_DN9395_c0_g2~~TRINITY_DN9395_c0_g2_i2.p2  ORF type:complete len:229 (-),score=65.63 TRINITY_DN9395_c0_g2_i2:182-868(-)